MSFPLSPLKTDQRIYLDDPKHQHKHKFWTIDVEARKWINFVVGGVCNGEEFWHFDTVDEMFHFLVEDGQSKKLFAHFGGKYDFLFFIDYLMREAPTEFTFDSGIPRGSGLLCFTVKYADKKRQKSCSLKFYDSSALLPFSLKKLTESFNVDHKKTEYDYENMPKKADKELLDYLETDCRGLHQVLTKFYNWPLVAKAGRSISMASQALRVFRTFMKEPINSLTSGEDRFVRKAYFGGRTEIFKPVFIKKDYGNKNLSCYDINSLYPSVMLYDMPTNSLGFTFDYDPDAMGFYEAEVEVPKMYIPPLGTVFEVNKTEKFIFPTGKFKGVFSTIELEYAKTQGVIVHSTGRGLLFKNGGPIFKEYIETLYKMRLEAKKKNDGVTDILTKLLMNSTYGRFGLRTRDREQIVEDTGEEGQKPFLEIMRNDKYSSRISKVKSNLNSFNNVAVAAWVTSLARITMHKQYVKCGKNIWYTDTDSLFTTENLGDSGKLGEMKEEYAVQKACFILPKTYVVENKDSEIHKVVMKGFDKKKTNHFTSDDFINALEGDLKLLKASSPAKFCTFKTAARKNNLLMMTEEAERNIRSRYDKRRFYKTKEGLYDSVPLHIENGKIRN